MNENNKKAIITGSAGFIGFHMAIKLLEEGWKVTGIDNFNAYYDLNLKNKRSKILKNNPFFSEIIGSIENKNFIKEIINKVKPKNKKSKDMVDLEINIPELLKYLD